MGEEIRSRGGRGSKIDKVSERDQERAGRRETEHGGRIGVAQRPSLTTKPFA